MKFIVLNKNEERIQNITTFSTKRKVKVNGLDSIEFESYDDFLDKYFRLLYKDDLGKWHEYIVSSVETIHDEQGVKYHIFAENSLVEIRGDFLEDLRAINSTAKNAIDKLLSSSKWKSKVESNKISTTNFYKTTAFEGLSKFLNDFGGEIDTEIIVSGEKVIDRFLIYKDIITKDNGKRFSFSKDIKSIKRTINDDEIITALYGFGKGEEIESENGTSYGRKIDFSDINNGKAYIENVDATRKYGFNGKPRFGIYNFDDITDKNILLSETKNILDKISKPNISYDIDVIDLKSYGLDFEGISCGDIVTIRDYDLDESLKARVLELEEDLDKLGATKLILGNTRKYILDGDKEFKDQLSNMLSKEKAYDKLVLDPIDLSNVVFMDSIVENLNNQFNSGTSHISFDRNRGLIITDKSKEAESDWIIEISSLGFRIANSKLSNGQWNFRTFGTGDGFSADLIRAGVLEGGKIHFDLQQGTFLIGNSPTDYEIYYDGTKLFLNVSSISATIKSATEEYINQNKDQLKGEKGAQGIKGEKGDPGAKGDQGEQGPKGDTGATGAKGADGKTPIMHFSYLALDKKETTDPRFEKGLNGMAVYNNARDGSVVITRQTDVVDSTQPVGNDRIKISHIKAGGAPNRGGFVINANAVANKVYLIEFTALLPIGAKLQMNNNSLGTGGTTYWISGTDGTGKFQNYSYVIKYGTGSIGGAGHVSIINSTEVFDWYVSYYERYDITNKFSFLPFDGVTHVGMYSDYSSTHSNLLSKYKWSLMKGDKGETGSTGATGVGLKTVENQYALSTSKDVAPTSGWSGTAIYEENKYLWRRLKITYTNGSIVYVGEEYVVDPNTIEDEIFEITTKLKTYTDKTDEHITSLAEIKKTITNLDGEIETVSKTSTAAKQTADSFTQEFTRLENALSDNEKETKEIKALIKSGMDANGNTYTEWGSSSNSTVRVGAGGIEMISNKVSTMVLKDGVVEAKALNVSERIGFGNHTAQKYKDEFTIFSWTGGK